MNLFREYFLFQFFPHRFYKEFNVESSLWLVLPRIITGIAISEALVHTLRYLLFSEIYGQNENILSHLARIGTQPVLGIFLWSALLTIKNKNFKKNLNLLSTMIYLFPGYLLIREILFVPLDLPVVSELLSAAYAMVYTFLLTHHGFGVRKERALVFAGVWFLFLAYLRLSSLGVL